MPLFKLLATDGSYTSKEVSADTAAEVFYLVQGLPCKEADVLQDGAYLCSLRLCDGGPWVIFQRDHVTGWEGNAMDVLAPLPS